MKYYNNLLWLFLDLSCPLVTVEHQLQGLNVSLLLGVVNTDFPKHFYDLKPQKTGMF